MQYYFKSTFHRHFYRYSTPISRFGIFLTENNRIGTVKPHMSKLNEDLHSTIDLDTSPFSIQTLKLARKIIHAATEGSSYKTSVLHLQI